MRKLYIFFLLFFPSFIYSQDACYNTYKAALQEYNKGNYAEAQRKFLVVAQSCGDYSDVWKNLKKCNEKIVEVQTQQTNEIKTLKSANQQLKTHNGELESDNVQLKKYKTDAASQKANADENIKKLRSDTAKLKKEIVRLQRENNSLRDTLKDLRKEAENNATATEKALEAVADSLAAVNAGITQMKAAITKLQEAYKNYAEKNEAKGLEKNPINGLQDDVDEMNKTLKTLSKKLDEVKKNANSNKPKPGTDTSARSNSTGRSNTTH